MTTARRRRVKVDYITGMNYVWWGLLHIVGMTLVWWGFRQVLSDQIYLYIPTDGVATLHMEANEAVLLSLMVVGFMILVPLRKRRYFRVICHVLSPIGLFLLVKLFPKWPIAVCLTLMLSLIYGILSLIQIFLTDLNPIPFSRRLKIKLWWSCTEIIRIVSGFLAAIAVFSAVALVTPAAKLIDPDTARTENSVITAEQRSAVAVLKPEEVLSSLQPETRQNMTEDALADLCQSIVDLQQQTLGFPIRAIVVLDDLPANMLGQYCHQTHTIELNRRYIWEAGADALAETICHEVFHAYQNSLAEAYNSLPQRYRTLMAVQEAAVYAENLENYTSGYENFDAYYYSPLELSARTYAQKQVQIYQLLAEESTTEHGEDTT